MAPLPEHVTEDNYGQDKFPSHRSHRTVAGTQQHTTDTSAFGHHHPYPAQPSHGPSTPTMPQTRAAPANPHPETPRRPGSTSDNGS